MGKTQLSELRDLALPYFKTSQDVVSYEGYAEVDPELCTQCGMCVEIGHCSAIEMGRKARSSIIRIVPDALPVWIYARQEQSA
ncbi:MAG: hypothetical protein GY806_09880, partial [Gammaproteobacteria bacterium]|nr:hypothetical protein [Gammaproteobacteria bacterium]